MQIKKLYIFLLALSLTSFSYAVNVNNSYYFIENQVDNAYFISPELTDPRFSGSNVYSKFATTAEQLSLGYMGYTEIIPLNYYADIWLENSRIDTPFIGNRCMRYYSPCPSIGYLTPEHIDKNGIYKIRMSTHVGEAGYARGIFSNSAYEYFKSLPTGSKENYQYKFCYINKDYNPKMGETCVSKGGRVVEHNFGMTKKGHLTLKSTNALQEIYIDSQGNPSIGLGSGFCTTGTVANVKGAICKLSSYEATGQVLPPMYIQMKANAAALGFKPLAHEIQFSANGTNNWKHYTALTLASSIFSPSNDGVYVFLSNSFFKNIISKGTNLGSGQDFFSFYFTNAAAPQSGFYEFSPSNTIVLKPKEYGISIISKDLGANPSQTGNVGDREPPIEFEYIVTTSGVRQANEITAQVKQTDGSPEKIAGQNYCIFSSPDKKIKVPFSAYLSYVGKNGETIKNRNSCADAEISLNSAQWQESSWGESSNQSLGSHYRTNLKLSFPMNEEISKHTIEGNFWDGVVRASGNIEVKAIWVGSDI